MSARHLQKPKRINLRDGTLGTALLVTLAMNGPAGAQALDNESHIPSDSHSGSIPSLNLLNSEEMLDPDYDPSSPGWRRWVALRIGCSLQICQAHLVDDDGPPLRHTRLGELYTPAELQGRKYTQAYLDSKVQEHRLQEVQSIVKYLLDAQGGGTQAAEWNEYKTKNQLQTACPETHSSIHRDLHAAQWLFTNAAPGFFAKHSRKFAELTRIIIDWTSQITPSRQLSDIPRVMAYGQARPWMMKTLGELDHLFKDHYKSRRRQETKSDACLIQS
eukprot:Blabericola_migrator_1__4220@NODE_2295_length_2987_cov_20_670548_g1439_i0_p1_GENE_NODE_2295_length_2987_cov_20_670548_g1439_i0NODE_2295_length_2987_cov_20_670548_g1439_i0_p1_ORF_typecomplete_len274_score27_36_NODE_2295_length_2987_cov_20_670548_g1439_i013642185